VIKVCETDKIYGRIIGKCGDNCVIRRKVLEWADTFDRGLTSAVQLIVSFVGSNRLQFILKERSRSGTAKE
jgi:hypothetical protein